jgi:hypothetical protein
MTAPNSTATSGAPASIPPNSSTDVEALLSGFLNKPPARSLQSIRERMLHWQDVANNPQNHLRDGSTGPAAIAARRKVAIQNLRELIKRNREIAAQLQSETNPQEAA